MSDDDWETLQNDPTMQSLRSQMEAKRSQGVSFSDPSVQALRTQIQDRAQELGVKLPEHAGKIGGHHHHGPKLSEEDQQTLDDDPTMQALRQQMEDLRANGAKPGSTDVETLRVRMEERARQLGINIAAPPAKPTFNAGTSGFSDSPTGDRAAILAGIRSR